jgi:5-methylcytosine-specific restriction endonuclease McrA
MALVELYENRCAYDGAPAPLHADHRLPLERGGTNVIENILPACRRCNLRKHLMTEEEFRARLAAERRGSAGYGPAEQVGKERSE